MDENTVIRSQNDVSWEYSETVELAESEFHRLLSSERRRLTLDVLLEGSAPVALDDLAVAVAERENDLAATEQDAIEGVKTTLHHVHLPMLAETDVIAYDLHECCVTSCPSRSEIPF